ncbi:hypothetical protein D3C74_375120 [compost metagenome]
MFAVCRLCEWHISGKDGLAAFWRNYNLPCLHGRDDLKRFASGLFLIIQHERIRASTTAVSRDNVTVIDDSVLLQCFNLECIIRDLTSCGHVYFRATAFKGTSILTFVSKAVHFTSILYGRWNDVSGNRACFQTGHIGQGQSTTKRKVRLCLGKSFIRCCQWFVKRDD